MASLATVLVTTCLMLLIMANIGDGGSLGINFGRQASQKLLPSMVVDMCLANGISKVKLFSVNEGVMSAFIGTNMELIIAIPNTEMKELSKDIVKMKYWMNKYITKYMKENEEKLNIRYLCVGVEPFAMIERDWNNDPGEIGQNVASTFKLIAEIRKDDDNLKKLKLGIPIATHFFGPVLKPSEGNFNKEFINQILEILPILSEMDAPFMLNIYPYYIINNSTDQMPLEFGFFDNQSNYTVQDGDLVYTNVFDLKYDTLVWALRKNGFGHMKIMVTQVGWPTDGGLGANVQNAKRFYDGLLKRVASNQGTPLVPDADLDVYLYVLSDENQRRTDRGPFERHYGIYDADGKPKFNLDFTLQGRDVEPESARGVSYLPQRWCILRENFREEEFELERDKLNRTYTEACLKGDCTALMNGSSCSSLDRKWKVSYAFNSFFQMANQEVLGDAACDWEGLGQVVAKIPNFPGCEFPVQILSTLFLNGMSNNEMAATLGETGHAGERLHLSYPLILIIPWWYWWMAGRWM